MFYNDIKNELSQNFIEYSVAVNTDRAIPDATSGLKPVAKRILWSTFESGYLASRSHVKSARVVGDVISRYHPHGDASIYGALVRLSQNWVMRYPLIDWHGNNGNIAGDEAAHMRYTEARLSKIAEDGMLSNIKKHNVDFIPNYDETCEEPVTLPALFPNLLCNPNAGIGVSIACNWLPHNLNEVARAIFDYMDDKEPMLSGPDFPTGGIIINKNDIPNIMKTGHGSVKVRGKYKIEKRNIIFYEIPYGIAIENLLKEISEVCEKKEIEGISDVRDESNKKGLRVVIECEKNIDPESIVKKLFKKTNLQTSISYNQIALIDKTPTECNLKDCIEIYINHNINCIVKEANFDLDKAKARQHIVEGLLKALEDIDNIISLIRNSKSAVAAKENLISRYQFSESQAKAIIDMRLGKLANLEKIELQQENQELINKIDDLNTLINNSDYQLQTLKNRLGDLVKKYGDDRRTELMQIVSDEEEKKAIPPKDVVVMLSVSSKDQTIKSILSKNFKIQKRGGKGVKKDEDISSNIISTKTDDTLILFTSKGRMFRLPVDKIPILSMSIKGISINTMLDLDLSEKIITGISFNNQKKAKYVVFITKKGLIKKTDINEYFKIKRNTGIAAIKFKEGDSLADVKFLNDEKIIVVTKKGVAIYFETEDIAPTGRFTMGVRAIKLNDDDEVLAGVPIQNETDMLLLATTNGYGKRCSLNEIPIQLRGGRGVCIYKTNPTTGVVSATDTINNEDKIIFNSSSNSICLKATEIPIAPRISIGRVLSKNNIYAIGKI